MNQKLIIPGLDVDETGLVYGCEVLRLKKNFQERMELAKSVVSNFKQIVDAVVEYKTDAIADGRIYPKCYRRKERDGVYGDGIPEKEIARGLFLIGDSSRFMLQPCAEEDIGTVVDYEIPLFHTRSKDAPRKVDMISVGRNSDEIFILELKAWNANDHLMRCLLEAHAYSLFADREKLKCDYKVSPSAKIVICPVVFKDSIAYEDFRAMQDGEAQPLMDLKKLIEADTEVEVRFAVLDKNAIPAFPPDPTGREFQADKWWYGTRSNFGEK